MTDETERQAILKELAAVVTALADLSHRLARPGGVPPAEIEAVLARKAALVARLEALHAARNPPPSA